MGGATGQGITRRVTKPGRDNPANAEPPRRHPDRHAALDRGAPAMAAAAVGKGTETMLHYYAIAERGSGNT